MSEQPTAENDAGLAEHVHDVGCAFGSPTCPAFAAPRCKACRGRGKRLHGWAICPRTCEDCGGEGYVVPPAKTEGDDHE